MRRLLVILSLIIIVGLIMPSLSLSAPVTVGNKDLNKFTIDPNWQNKIPKKLFDDVYTNVKIKKAAFMPYGIQTVKKIMLFDSNSRTLLLIGDNSENTVRYIIQNTEKLLYKFPLLGNHVIYYVVATPDQVVKLAKYPGIYRITPSPSITELIKLNNMIKKAEGAGSSFEIKIADNNENATIDTNMGVKLIGATEVWREYNITGEGIVVGIVDTGIDLSNPDLGLDVIARDVNGTPLLLAYDNGLTLVTGKAVAYNGTLNTTGLTVLAFDPLYTLVYGIPVLIEAQFDYNITVGNITSQSGIYRVGLAPYLFGDTLTGYYIRTFVPVVLVDSETPGVYDEAYFDLSTAFYDLSEFMRYLENVTLGHIYWRAPDPAWNDTSITDETPFGPGNEIVGRDFDGDGIIDFSIGTIAGYYLDSYGLATLTYDPVTENIILGTPGLYPGWDYQGRYLALVSDFHGHGTSVATVIASRGRVLYDLYGDGKLYRIMGVAPGAKIAGGDAWLLGNILVLEAWLAGFNIVTEEEDGYVYLSLDPFGPHRADIISNSWGSIYINFWLQQFPGIDYRSSFMDEILAIRNYLIGDHVTIVFAAGNEGPGYSSNGAPGTGLLVITAGASTLWDYTRIYGYPEGYADEVIPFSSRGPTGQGYPKPDIVNIGAFEWASTRTIDGRGYGAQPDVFGGTSEATPYTSGTLALVFQAYKEVYNTTPDPVTAKIILKSSAKDIWYPAFSQGSGRVDALKAVETVFNSEWLAYVSEGIQEAFLENYYTDFGPYIGYVLPYLADTAYYGVVKPGSSKNFTLNIVGNGTVSLSAWNTVLYKEYTVYDGVYDYSGLLFLKVPKYAYSGADYVEVVVQLENMTYPPGVFLITPIDPLHAIILSAYDWIDYNGDGQIGYPDELHYITFEYRVSTEAVVSISAPMEKIHGDLVLRIRPDYINVTPVKMKIVVRSFKYVPCKLMSLPQTVDVNGTASIPITINVPNNFRPGILEVRLIVDTPDKRIVVPVSILVPLIADETTTAVLGGARSPMKYDPFAMYGLPDPVYGVWEGQDWRILPVLVTDPSITGLIVVARWASGYASDLSFLTVAPGGVFTPNGFLNVFASYKLSYDLGLVYNPSLSDQLHGKLRMYIPVKWAEPLRQIPIAITDLSYWPPEPGLALMQYSDRMPEIYGLYRVIYGFASYSGKLLEDKLMFRIITVKSEIQYSEQFSFNNISVGNLYVKFTAGSYTPFLFADLYLYTEGYATPLAGSGSILPISILVNGTASNLAYYLVLYDYAYYLGTSPTGLYSEFTVPVMINTSATNVFNAIAVMYKYPWHAEGMYWFDFNTGEPLIISYVHPGMASATLNISNT